MCVYYVICQNHNRIGPFESENEANSAAINHLNNLDDHGKVSVIMECSFEGKKKSKKVWDFN